MKGGICFDFKSFFVDRCVRGENERATAFPYISSVSFGGDSAVL